MEGIKFSQQDLELVAHIAQRAQCSDPRQHNPYHEVATLVQENRRPNNIEDNIDRVIAEIISIIQEIRANVFDVKCDGIKYELSMALKDKSLIFNIIKDDRKLWEIFKKKPEPLCLKLSESGFKHGYERNFGANKREFEYTSSSYRNIQMYLINFRNLLKTFHKKWTTSKSRNKQPK